MSVASRSSDIPIQGEASYAPDEGRFRTKTGWWQPNAALAADFYNARYARNGVDLALGDALATVRSSAHFLAGPDGVYQSFATNTLARITAVGAYIGRQVTNKSVNYNANPASTAGVTKYGTGSVLSIVDDQAALAAAGLQNIATSGKVYKLDNSAGTSEGGVMFSGSAGNVNKHTASVYMRTVGGTACVAIDSSIASAFDTYAAYSRVAVTGTPVDTGRGAQIKVAAGGVAYFILNQLEENTFTTPPIATAGAAATRYASDVQAASMGWFNAAGLASGGAALIVPNYASVGHGVSRTLFELSDGTANNLVRAHVDASDKPALLIVAGGVTQIDTALSVAVALGRNPLAFAWSAGGGYVVDRAGNVASFGAITLPGGLSVLRLGSSVAGNYLNAKLEQIHICSTIQQTDGQTWAVTA